VLVAFLLLSLPRAVWSLSGKVGWLSEVWQVFHYRAAPIIGDWLYYQEVLLSVAFFLSPFLVVVNGRPAGSALLANLAFVRQRFLKWAIMLGLAIACLAGAGLLRLVVARYFWLPRAQWWELIPPAIARMAQVTVQAICAIALFDFFLQHGATDAAAPRAAEPTPAPA
jgi:hypothetical protein